MLKYFSIIFLALIAASAWGATPKDVVVIINDNSTISKEVGAYYVSKRKIPAKNVVHIKTSTNDTIPIKQYQDEIETPVRKYLDKTDLTYNIDYMVLTKGIPLRLEKGWSVDGALMCMIRTYNMNYPNIQTFNLYYGKNEHFSRQRYGFYLATRLDGYTAADAKKLVDRSLAAKPSKGEFLIDTAPGRDTGGYGIMNASMRAASQNIKHRGFTSDLDESVEFVGDRKGLMGYFSWGSNDAKYSLEKYKSNRFLPGAIAETAVSTSARTFGHVDKGQSIIADLIESGVTGVKGYVNEPYLTAIANPEILFDRYLSGYNLAESFYMASQFIFWRDLVVGDPLCAPYAKKK